MAKHLSRLEKSTFDNRTKMGKSFYDGLMKTPMVEITADEISRHLAH